MPFRCNKGTIECLIIVVTLITVPLSLCTSLLRPVDKASAWIDAWMDVKLRKSADVYGGQVAKKVLKLPDQHPW